MKQESGSRLMKFWFICTLICVFYELSFACFVAGITIIRALTKRKWHISPCLIFTLHANGMLIIVTDQRSMASVILLPPHSPTPPHPTSITAHPLTTLAMRKSFGNEHIVCILFFPGPWWSMECRMGLNDVPAWAIFPFDQRWQKKRRLCLWIEGKTTNEDKRFSFTCSASHSFLYFFLSLCFIKQMRSLNIRSCNALLAG